MRALSVGVWVLLGCATVAPGSRAQVVTAEAEPRTKSAAVTRSKPRPINFAGIDRTIAKLPQFVAAEQRYGLLLFGTEGKKRVWAVLDASRPNSSRFDVLYLDLNANGDLTDAGERFEGKAWGRGGSQFAIAELRDPGTGAVHTNVSISWRPKSERMGEGTRFKMKWRGDKITMGPYGPYNKTYQSFAKTPERAPIFVPGYDRPFAFQHWMCDELERGRATEFKVFVGNRGDRTGAFFCVDDKFVAIKDSPTATLIYEDEGGKKRRHHVKLTSRC